MQFSNINYNLYKSFLIVYETKNISRAADLLYISQPAVSHNIKELEKQLGISLFFKKSGGVNPTNEADVLYKYISSAFNSIWKGEHTISEMAGLKTGVVRIGTLSNLCVIYLSKVVTEFKKAFPNIKIEIICKTSSELSNLLQSQNIDIMIDNQPIFIEKGKNEVKYLKSFSHCFVTTKKYYSEKQFGMEIINQMPIIISSFNSEEIKLLKNAFPDIKLNPVIDAGSPESMISFVKDGNGIGYTQEDYVESDIKTGVLKKLKINFELPKLDVYCAYMTETLAYAPKKFIEWLISKN